MKLSVQLNISWLNLVFEECNKHRVLVEVHIWETDEDWCYLFIVIIIMNAFSQYYILQPDSFACIYEYLHETNE